MKYIKNIWIHILVLSIFSLPTSNVLARCCYKKGDICPNWKVVYVNKSGYIKSIGLENEKGDKKKIIYDGHGSMSCSDCGYPVTDHVLNKENFRQGFRIKSKRCIDS